MARPEALLGAAILVSLPAAAEAAERHRLNIPAGRLGDAVVALGRQAGISIGVSDPHLAHIRVRSLAGTFTIRDALRHLLKGTEANAVLLDVETVRIVRAPFARKSQLAKKPLKRPRARPAPPRPTLAPEEQEQTIIVTAAKRRVAFDAYPGTVSLVGGDDPALQAGVRGTEALSGRLPSLSSTHLGPGRNKLFLRGIADSSFNGPTQATVGQYLGETRLNYNAPDPDLRLFDLDRIEVLSGPQGTLYGAGSIGGIIRIIPKMPELDSTQALISIGASATEHAGSPGVDAAGILNLPLTDRAALRLVGYGVEESGYIDDPQRELKDVNRTRIAGGRAALRLKPGSDWTIDLGTTLQRIRGKDAQSADRDGPPLTRRSPIAQPFDNDYFLGELVVTRQWDRLRLTSSFGHVRQRLNDRYDSTLTPAIIEVLDQNTRIRFSSAESRLAYEGAGGLSWLGGISLINNRSRQIRASGLPGQLRAIGVENDISEATLFGEGTAALGNNLMATAGGRLSYARLSDVALHLSGDRQERERGARFSRTEVRFLPSAALSYKPTSDLLAFFRYQQGYRPGSLAIFNSGTRAYRGDQAHAFEIGTRYRPRANAPFYADIAFAYTRWNDIQADIINLGSLVTANIGDGRIYSLDLSAGWRPLPRLRLDLAAVFNDAKVTNPASILSLAANAGGSSRIPNVSRANLRAGAEYATHLAAGYDLSINAAARYSGKSRLGVGEIFDDNIQGDWLDTSLGARLQAGKHAFSISVTNLLGVEGNRFALGSPLLIGIRPQVTPLRPRTLRVGWETRF